MSIKKHLARFRPIKRRSISLLPNLFTLGNAFFGFSSLVFIAKENFVAGAYAILLGSLMDMLDGRIARYTGSASDLGLQLDSLCDAISFCVAPAFLFYFWQLEPLGVLGLGACAFFLLTGVLRLARFNITHSAQTIYFLGVPTTLSAITLVLVSLNFQNVDFTLMQRWLILCLVITLGFLMISKIKFPALKKIKNTWYAVFFLMSLASFITFGCLKLGLFFVCFYFLFALEENIRIKLKYHTD